MCDSAYAQYEEIVLKYIENQPRFIEWHSQNGLADTIWKLVTARRQLSKEFGGYGTGINRYLSKKRLPSLFDEMTRQAKVYMEIMIQHLTESESPETSNTIEKQFSVFKQFLEVELQDSLYSNRLKPLLPKLEEMIKKFPNQDHMEIIRPITNLRPPSRPSFDWMESNQAAPSRTDLKWLACDYP